MAMTTMAKKTITPTSMTPTTKKMMKIMMMVKALFVNK
jgi:hypothetical protein